MRILQINTYHYRRGGDCVHALALGDALSEAGHEVRFFGMQHPQNLPSADSEYWMPYIDFAELNQSRSVKGAVQVLRRTLYSHQAARRLGDMIDRWRPDVAHLHSIHGHLSLSVLVELGRRGIPVVWTLHDYKLLCPNTQLMVRGAVCERCRGNRFTQCTLNRCKKDSLAASVMATLEAEVDEIIDPERRVDRFIAPSRFLVEKFADFGWSTAKFEHIPSFTPADSVPVARTPEQGRFVYTGRLDPAKGVGTLIEAVGRTAGVTLDVAGEGPMEAELRALAEAVAPGRVTFHGRVGPPELAALRDLSLAAVVPSEWYENSPYAVTEAFGRGCPVVAADIGGLPELVSGDGNGLLFTPGDAEGLAAALRRLASDPALQESLSAGALASAGHLGIDQYIPRLLAVYRSAAGRPTTSERPQ
jgi:glycosyltransferase involved in cell wall biosynthesis